MQEAASELLGPFEFAMRKNAEKIPIETYEAPHETADAPSLDAQLKIEYLPRDGEFLCYYEQTFSPDCGLIIGWGHTPEDCVLSYRRQWKERYGG